MSHHLRPVHGKPKFEPVRISRTAKWGDGMPLDADDIERIARDGSSPEDEVDYDHPARDEADRRWGMGRSRS